MIFFFFRQFTFSNFYLDCFSPFLFGLLFLFWTFISFLDFYIFFGLLLDFYFTFCTNRDLILDFFQVFFVNNIFPLLQPRRGRGILCSQCTYLGGCPQCFGMLLHPPILADQLTLHAVSDYCKVHAICSYKQGSYKQD